MLIERIKIIDHPSIGTVELDFRDSTGEPSRTIVIAGQNGVGKTVFLEAIQNLFEQFFNFPGQVEADIIINNNERDRIINQLSQYASSGDLLLGNKIHAVRREHMPFSIVDGQIAQGRPFGVEVGPNGFAFRTFYSPANVIYPGNILQTVSAGEIDRPDVISYRSNAEGQSIPELLLALEFQDASALKRYAEENPTVNPIGAVPSLLKRFRDAFAIMFPTKRFSRIRSENGQFHITFEENGVETTIHQLSTGEKQVVFRSSFFLRDAGVMKYSVILIDEPELSLSPDWQSKILPFYAQSLSVENSPHPQIICTTHSPFIVHSAGAGKVIVLQRTTDGRVEEMPEPVFPGASSAIAVRAFNLDQFVETVQSGEMAVVTEGKTDHLILTAAWEKLYAGQQMPFQIRPGAGAEKLQHLLNNLALPALSRGKVVGLFDFDSAWDRWDGTLKNLNPVVMNTSDATGCLKRHPTLPLWAMLLPVPAFRSEMASSAMAGRSLLSIELMFPDAVIPARMKSEQDYPGGLRFPRFNDGCKNKFAQEVVPVLNAIDFEAFRPLFERLLEIQRAPISSPHPSYSSFDSPASTR